MNELLEPALTSEPPPKVILRATRSYSYTNGVVTQYMALRTRKRDSVGFNFFEADIEEMGADVVMESVVNLHDVENGIYELIYVNMGYDESGYLDTFQYKLVPLDEEEETNE